jgi:hypothetical protein
MLQVLRVPSERCGREPGSDVLGLGPTPKQPRVVGFYVSAPGVNGNVAGGQVCQSGTKDDAARPESGTASLQTSPRQGRTGGRCFVWILLAWTRHSTGDGCIRPRRADAEMGGEATTQCANGRAHGYRHFFGDSVRRWRPRPCRRGRAPDSRRASSRGDGADCTRHQPRRRRKRDAYSGGYPTHARRPIESG